MTHAGNPTSCRGPAGASAAEKMEPEEKADISTLEKTGHLYFGPTPKRSLNFLFPEIDIGSNALAFDSTQMQAGFDGGYELGKSPDPWSDVPPLLGDVPDWALEVMNTRKR